MRDPIGAIFPVHTHNATLIVSSWPGLSYLVCVEEPWGIISIKAQDVDRELPMQPITMLRNALGKDQGGSGVLLDAVKYKASAAFWSKHITVRRTE